LSHYVFNSLLDVNDQLESNTGFSLFSKRDLITLLTSIVSGFCFVVIIILAYKVKQVYLALAILKSVKAQSVPNILRYGSTTTTTISPMAYAGWLQTVMEINWLYWIIILALVIVVTLVIIILALLIHFNHRRHHINTKLLLEIGNENIRFTYDWNNLTGPSRFYDFKIFGLNSSVERVDAFLRTSITFKLENLKIVHKYLGYEVPVNPWTVCVFSQRRKLAELISNDDFYVALVMQESSATEMVVLRQQKTKNVVINVNNVNKLYPDLGAVNSV